MLTAPSHVLNTPSPPLLSSALWYANAESRFRATRPTSYRATRWTRRTTFSPRCSVSSARRWRLALTTRELAPTMLPSGSYIRRSTGTRRRCTWYFLFVYVLPGIMFVNIADGEFWCCVYFDSCFYSRLLLCAVFWPFVSSALASRGLAPTIPLFGSYVRHSTSTGTV